MGHEATGADLAIWLVAALIYVVDAVRLLPPGELLLVEAGGGRLTAAFSAQPFTLAGRVLSVPPLARPDRGVFVAPWGEPSTDAARLRATVEAIGRVRAGLGPLRGLAVWAAALLFVAGPALALTRGPAVAVLAVAALAYPSAVAAALLLWWRRRTFGLSGPRCLGLGVEMVVCPAVLPNVVRKVTAVRALDADGGQVLVATGAPEDVAAFRARLEARAEDVLEELGPDGAARLRAYLATVRSAR